MPKITLLNTETGKTQDFEPIDAREVLANPKTIYTVPNATRAEVDREGKPAMNTGGTYVQTEDGRVNVPQLQGDPEMQTGLASDKYQRQDIVKAQAGNVTKTVTDGWGTPIEGKGDAGPGVDGWGDTTVTQLKELLSQRGVQYGSKSTKAELQALVEANRAK